MSGKPQDVSVFFQNWLSEFTQSIEMFTGEAPVVECQSIELTELPDDTDSAFVWWKQVFVCGDSSASNLGTAWIGTPQATWTILGASLGDNAEEIKSTYLEIVQQSVLGAAHVLTGELKKKIICGEGGIAEKPVSDVCETVTVIIKSQGKKLPGIIAAIDGSFSMQMETSEAAPTEVQAPSMLERSIPVMRNTSILGSVIDLSLRFSVVLGRATLPIRDVLKLAAGSLIELDHLVNDPVELVIRGAVVAYCDIVQVKGNYGIRIQKIISPEDRMNLKGPLEKARMGRR